MILAGTVFTATCSAKKQSKLAVNLGKLEHTSCHGPGEKKKYDGQYVKKNGSVYRHKLQGCSLSRQYRLYLGRTICFSFAQQVAHLDNWGFEFDRERNQLVIYAHFNISPSLSCCSNLHTEYKGVFRFIGAKYCSDILGTKHCSESCCESQTTNPGRRGN